MIGEIKFLTSKILENKIHLIKFSFLFIILSILTAVVNVIMPKYILESLIFDNGRTFKMVLVAFFAALLIASPLVSYIEKRLNSKQTSLRMNIMLDVQSSILNMSYDKLESTEMIEKKDAAFQSLVSFDSGVQYIFNRSNLLIINVILLIVYSSIISTLSFYLLLFLIASTTLKYWYNSKFNNHKIEQQTKIWKSERKAKYFLDIMSNHRYGKEIRLFSLSDWLMKKTEEFFKESENLKKDLISIENKNSIFDYFVNFIGEGIIYATLVIGIINGSLFVSDFLLLFAAIKSFSISIDTTITLYTSIQSNLALISNIREICEIEKTNKNEDGIQLEDKFEIDFINVTFRYPNSEKDILKGFNMKVKSGSKIAIVGDNGAGKSTLIKLLSKLYKPTSGLICINGIDIQSIPNTDYYKILTSVFQDFKILAFSVLENVTLDDSNFNEDKYVDSLQKLNILTKVKKLPNGDHTNMSKVIDANAVEFSGGDKQKLAISRALYRDSNIVLLDEPTAGLSPFAEEEFYNNLNELIKNKTVFFVTHRLASTSFCDEIMLIEGGRIAERGSHEKLLEMNGKYKVMYDRQSMHYKKVGA